MTYEEPRIIHFKTFPAPSGGLISLGGLGDVIPFPIKNIYWLHHLDKTYKKGNHANKITKQIVIALSGRVKATLISKTEDSQSFVLDDPGHGLFIPSLYWKEFEIEKGGILLSVTSQPYEKSDNFYDYQDFLQSAIKL